MILFSATKTMNIGDKQEVNLSFKTRELLTIIKSLDIESLATTFKIKGETLNKTYNYYENFPLSTLKAIDAYDGISYKQIDNKDTEYIKKNVKILSAFYGLTSSCNLIANYRLDFTTRGLFDFSLYEYWREDVTSKLIEMDCDILLLTSNEYTKMIDLKKITKNVFQVQAKSHSVNLKKMRGMILNYCSVNNINDYQLLEKVDNDLFFVTEIVSNTIKVEFK